MRIFTLTCLPPKCSALALLISRLDTGFFLRHNDGVTYSLFQQFQQFQQCRRPRQKAALLLRAYACPVLALLWFLLFGGIAPVAAQTPSVPAHRVIILLVPSLRADDLTRGPLPALTALRGEGAAGWMVCRAARADNSRQLTPDGRDTSGSLTLTLSSGTRALAQSSIVNRQSPIANRQSSLGALAHAQGWRATVYGNADTDTVQGERLLLAGDEQGRVDVAQTQTLSNAESTYAPYGRRDDIDRLERALASLSERDALTVLVFGDLARADSYGPLCLPAQRDAQRLVALRSLDSLLTNLRAQTQTLSGPPLRFLLLSPAPAASTEVRDRLAPILMWGRDAPAGILTSPSTRVPGIVVNTDFLPAVADAWGLPLLPGAIGRPFHVQPSSQTNTLADWQAAHDRVLQTERLKDVYGGLPTLQMLLVLVALALYQKGQRRFACACCAAIVSLPFALLMLPSLPLVPHSIPGAGAMLALVALAFAGIAWRLYPSRRGVPLLLTVLFAVLLGAIALDLLSGSPLLRQAWMSYSIMEAARFYGIGNEYMGVVIGAACILLGNREQGTGNRRTPLNSQLSTKPFYSLFPVPCSLLLLLFLLGYNRFGAKVGAIPSAGIAFGVQGLMLWRGKLRGRDLLLVAVGVAMGLGGLLLLDMRHGVSGQSHFARTVAGSGGGLFAAASRKMLLEGHLLLHSPWSAALLTASMGFVYIGRQGDRETRRQGEEERQGTEQEPLSTINYQLSTPYGLIAGALASLLFNDSGVTAAAMIMLFGFAWALTQAADRERLLLPEHPQP